MAEAGARSWDEGGEASMETSWSVTRLSRWIQNPSHAAAKTTGP